MTDIDAPGSWLLTDQELFKLTQSADIMTRIELLKRSSILVLKSLVQYRNTFKSNYDGSFTEAGICSLQGRKVSGIFAECG